MLKNKIKLIFKISLSFFALMSIILFIGCSIVESPAKFDTESASSNTEEGSEASNVDSHEDNMELFFNIKNKQKDKNILNNINVRKAIFHAIDRERIINELFEDTNNVLNSLFNENSSFSNPVWDKLEYNKEKAIEYLESAGYGPDNPLYLTIGSNDNSATRLKIEEIIRENLEEIGIKIWISNHSSSEWYNEHIRLGNYELALWSLYTYDSSELLNYFSTTKIPVNETTENQNCNNFYWYSNNNIDENLQKLILTKDVKEKKDIIDEVQNKIFEDSFILPLFSRLYAVAFNEKIENIKINPSDGNYLSSIQNVKLNLEEEEEAETELIIGTDNMPSTMNPLLEENIFMNYLNSMILRGLWKLDKDGVYVTDLIDESKSLTTISRSDNSIFITLKKDIFWQDGSKVNSGDVKATIEAIISEKNLNLKETAYKNIKEIKIVSDNEFYVYFSDPIQNYERLFTFILPAKMLEKDNIGNLLIDDSFGSGPYKLTEWVKDQYMLLQKNIYYENNLSEVERIRIVFEADKNLLITSLKNEEIDLVSIPVDLKLINELDENKKINVLIEKGNLWEHLAVCLKPVE
ncbi:MAG: ABC transporter substrate-binding protein [Actinomycetota bacterium]|nr:ABC transporter substrate-binding protein [Actinomycetota bacterium]